MTIMEKPGAHGTLIAPDTLEIRRVLPAPPERVWAWLTDSELRRKWLAAGEMTLVPGAECELVWRNDELTDPPGTRPGDIGDENRMTCRVIAVDPPRSLSITWGKASDVTFTLAPRGEGTLLTIVHARLPDRASLLGVSAGWHAHLGVLVSLVEGSKPAPFWDAFTALRTDYDQRLP
ncbi:SRPBCC family protein [Stappia indica]|uniref:Uncharacterized conserved protein YndB, AHSA1/START domain n=1 Tax=Stappia indica TaxID=538381 RepID=A0A285TMY1_9HYPH|nr:SRPBCC family protein [Stappia indica]SOC24048.1 Uncharacterized conserved protein YndB, AHSA1/START domain [Stappia indica]